MRIETTKTMYVGNNSNQTASLAHSERLEYIYEMIENSPEDAHLYKVMLIKFVRDHMDNPGLREAKIFVEDALGQ